MALSKDILGTSLYNAEKQFNDKDLATLGDIETVRLQFWKIMAEKIIDHFKGNAVVTTTGNATNHTGTITA